MYMYMYILQYCCVVCVCAMLFVRFVSEKFSSLRVGDGGVASLKLHPQHLCVEKIQEICPFITTKQVYTCIYIVHYLTLCMYTTVTLLILKCHAGTYIIIYVHVFLCVLIQKWKKKTQSYTMLFYKFFL